MQRSLELWRASSWCCPHVLLSAARHVIAGRMFHRGGVCCGKTPAAHAMEYKMMARNPRSGGTEVWQLSLGARDPIQFSIPHTCGVIPALQCGASCQSGSAQLRLLCPSTASAESRAPLCVSSHCFILFPPATGCLQCQRDVSIINGSPLLMRSQLLQPP